MITVIFPAAGQGKRMKAGMNKVFLELGGLPIFIRTLLKFSSCSCIDEMIVVAAPDEVEDMKQLLSTVEGLKPYKVVSGGSERQYSVWNGLKAAAADTEIVLVHDAARPLVSEDTILRTIDEARLSGGAVAAVKAKNTIKRCNGDGVVEETPDRAFLWEIQTPQTFRMQLLMKANQKAEEDGFLGTDDASLVERLGAMVKIVESDYYNIKITTPEDLVIAEAFLKAQEGNR